MIVFVLIMLPTPRSTRSDTLLPDKTPFLSAAGYGFKGVKLDGNDPVEFYKGMKEVIDEIRAGKGPIFVEATTYRLGPHAGVGRSEEQTAELPSLMRHPYAVFCLTKKHQTVTQSNNRQCNHQLIPRQND